MAECAPDGQKTLWEKGKLLVTSDFSFSHSVFKRLVLQTRKNKGLFGKGLTFFFFLVDRSVQYWMPFSRLATWRGIT